MKTEYWFAFVWGLFSTAMCLAAFILNMQYEGFTNLSKFGLGLLIVSIVSFVVIVDMILEKHSFDLLITGKSW